MKNATLSRLAALALTVALGAFGCATKGDSGTAPDEAATETAAEASMPMDSGEILHVLQTINTAEVDHAQLALQKSQNPQVQQIAETIIQDHRAMNQRIDQVAQQADAELEESELSNTIESQTSQIRDRLADLSGEQFDREFLRTQVQLHELSLQTAREDLMPSATDPQVVELLTMASSHLEEHLQVAQRSLDQLEDSAVGGGPEDQEDIEERDLDEEDLDEPDLDEQDIDDY